MTKFTIPRGTKTAFRIPAKPAQPEKQNIERISVSAEVASEMLGVSVSTMWSLAKTQKIRTVRIGTRGQMGRFFLCDLCVCFASFAVKKDLTAENAKDAQGAQSPISYRCQYKSLCFNHKGHKEDFFTFQTAYTSPGR